MKWFMFTSAIFIPCSIFEIQPDVLRPVSIISQMDYSFSQTPPHPGPLHKWRGSDDSANAISQKDYSFSHIL